MDRIREHAFLATIASLIGLEVASLFLLRLPWVRGFTPLGWTAIVRCLDILLFFVLFGILHVPLSAAGVRRFIMGSVTGLVVSQILGSSFFLILHSIRWLWGVDLRVFLYSGVKVSGLAPLAVLCLLGPFAEEIFFRGLCYTVIRAHTRVWVSVVLSAALFGATHFLGGGTLSGVLVPFVGGIVFALLYEFTGSLLAPFILHGLGNFVLFSRIL